MFYHDKPGWEIAIRIILVLVLIGGAVLAVRAAFYQGYAAGLGKAGYGKNPYSGEKSKMDYYERDGMMPYHMDPDGMFYHHQGGFMPHRAYPGMMGCSTAGGWWGGALHFLLGVLGFFLLVKLILGLGGGSWYWRGMPAGGPWGNYHHRRSHHCGCPCCAEESPEDLAPEAPEEVKPARKSGRSAK